MLFLNATLSFLTPTSLLLYPSHHFHLAFDSQPTSYFIFKKSTFSRVSWSGFPFFFTRLPLQRPLCSFCNPLCSSLPAFTSRHRWLKCTTRQGGAVGWSQDVITSSTSCTLWVGCECRQPGGSSRDVFQPSALTEHRPSWTDSQTGPPGIFPGAPD